MVRRCSQAETKPGHLPALDRVSSETVLSCQFRGDKWLMPMPMLLGL
jgi:hypothetical protein